MARRVLLFLLTNIGVILTISIVTQLLGIDGYLTAKGIDYTSLLVFCSLWGMGGAFISLAISKKMAKWMMKVQVIDPSSSPSEYVSLVHTVHRLARAAGLEKMPEVGVYPSDEVNAFATGPSKKNSLVAVSAGMLQKMDRAEMEGVLGHEVAHIANGDMVTMTLIQGVVNAFVLFLSMTFTIVAAIAGAAFAFTSCKSNKTETTEKENNNTPTSVTSAFTNACTTCHNADGIGGGIASSSDLISYAKNNSFSTYLDLIRESPPTGMQVIDASAYSDAAAKSDYDFFKAQ